MAKKVPSRSEAEEMFNQLDTSGNGELSPAEVVTFLEGNGYSNEEALAIFEGIDTSEDKKITLQEFVDQICAKPRSDALEAVFADMDKDGTGKLSLDEVKEALAAAGLSDAKTIESCFERMDKDENGSVDKAEFLDFMNQNY